MNERIKELALQAMTYVTHNPKANKLNSGDMFDEKFAELIVRECAEIVDDKIEVSRYVHEAELLRECSTTIKLHFGVEE
jgi:hypothetical protein